jgi:hypothetical protein
MNFKPRVKSEGRWHGTNIVFASRREAQGYAGDVAAVFSHGELAITAWRANPTREPVSHSYSGCELKPMAHAA